VACSAASATPERPDAGYATAAAALTALALSLVVSAIMSASLTDLRAARAALDRTRVEASLDGAQQAAVAALLDAGAPARLRWIVPASRGAIEILAEPEAPKLALSAAADLADGELLALAPGEAGSIRPRLRALALSGASSADVARLGATPLWRACAASSISPYGQGGSLALSTAAPPSQGRFSWRAGEMWRLRALSPDGWADDRIVRLTGDAEHPAAIIERVLVRGQRGGEPCGVLIESGA
jgi:multidrug efflux pump subunit AcrA (membrane-fusion protein)